MTTKTYGTVSSERQKLMSGLEFVTGLASGALPLNTIAQTLGYDVVDAERGRVAITLRPTGAHLNPWGTVHGGLTAILLDSCMEKRKSISVGHRTMPPFVETAAEEWQWRYPPRKFDAVRPIFFPAVLRRNKHPSKTHSGVAPPRLRESIKGSEH